MTMRLTNEHSHAASLPAPARWPGLFAVGGLGVVMAGIFALDQGTGLPHVQHLYYLPIIFAGVRFGIAGGAGAAAVAIALYHLANVQALTWQYEESDILQMAVFAAVGIVAARLAGDARRLHQLAMT